jgi:hypothetical protein
MTEGAAAPRPEATREAVEAAREELRAAVGGHWMARHLVYVFAELGLADLLLAGPRPAHELAAATGAHAPTLRRVLRGMVAFRLVTEEADGRFALGAAGRLLGSGASHGLRGRVIKDHELEQAWWGGLLHAVRTGEPAFAHVFGEGAFAHFARDPAVHPHLNPGTPWEVARAVAAAYDFAPFETAVDVGGGDGIVLAAILQRYPFLRGVVLDQPHVVERARPVMEQAGVAGRCRLVAGDFFGGVPAGDVYVLKKILHDWDDAPAARILRRCRQAMSARGRILAVESPLPERAAGDSHRFDLVMLVEMGGRERTVGEYRALFAAAGLTLTAVRPLEAGRDTGRSLIEAAPAPGE